MLPPLLALLALSVAATSLTLSQEARDASSRYFRGSFSPTQLGPDDVTPEEAYAFALGLAMEGRFDDAAQAMGALVEIRASALHPRIAREAQRIDLFRDERRAYLLHLQESGRKLNLRKTALKLLAPIEEIRESEVVLGKNRAKIDVLKLDDIDAIALSQIILKSDHAFSFIAVYPQVLNGKGQKSSALSENSKEARSLREDLETGFDGHTERAAAARRLVQLSRVELPVPAAKLESTLAWVADLANSYPNVDLVRARKPLLERMAAEILKAGFEEQGLAASLKGAYEPLPDGRMRLSYSFRSVQELLDFKQDGYLKEHAFHPANPVEIKDKHLVARNFFSLRHILDFEGETSVRLTWRYPETAAWKYLFWLGLNDDGEGNFVAAKLDGGLIVIDQAKDSVREETGAFAWKFDDTYTLEIRYDGKNKAYASMDGMAIKNINVGPRRAGGVFLFVCSRMALEVHELVIEGRLDASMLNRLRDAWMGRELAALGI